MTNRLLIFLVLPAAAVALASCSSAPTCGNSHQYLTGYATHAPLKAPAGVTLPTADPAYKIPVAGTAPAPVAAPAAGISAAPCLVTPPTVLTPEDMNKVVKPAPVAKPAVAAPAADTKAAAKPVPSAASNPPPVAGGGAME
ncbi:MAG TPA: hypothetical protein VGN70_02515 [Gammaproteobacteria bacterium]